MNNTAPIVASSPGNRHPSLSRVQQRTLGSSWARLIPLCLAVVSLCPVATLCPAAFGQPIVDSQAALNEGNRLFREGQVEAAVTSYIEGYSAAAPHPTLLYNLGTALHHLDRLPEAILWYRRAATSDDPWLEENLWLARRSLGSQILPAAGIIGWLSRHDQAIALFAIGLSWIVFFLLITNSRFPRWLLIAGAALAMTLYGLAMFSERWGPQPAIVLEDCLTAAGDLPAGTEAWVRRTTGDRWSISGVNGAVCPPEAVELVFPSR